MPMMEAELNDNEDSNEQTAWVDGKPIAVMEPNRPQNMFNSKSVSSLVDKVRGWFSKLKNTKLEQQNPPISYTTYSPTATFAPNAGYWPANLQSENGKSYIMESNHLDSNSPSPTDIQPPAVFAMAPGYKAYKPAGLDVKKRTSLVSTDLTNYNLKLRENPYKNNIFE